MPPLEQLSLRLLARCGAKTLGTATWIDSAHALTCAHVVEVWAAPQKPQIGDQVTLTESSGARAQVSAKIKALGNSAAPADDFALLKMFEAARPAWLPRLSMDINVEHGFDAFGFPAGWDQQGNFATGVVGRRDLGGAVELHGNQQGFAIRGGFSGGPVWDRLAGALIGIVTGNAEPGASNLRVGFMLPFGTLFEKPELAWLTPVRPEFDAVAMADFLEASASAQDTPRAVAFLIQLVERYEDDPVSRYWIYHALGTTGGTRARATLQSASRCESDEFAQQGAQEALSLLCRAMG